MKYGILVACCKMPDTCLIRGLENLALPLGELILNEALLSTITTQHIARAVSIVHECCQFVVTQWPRTVERETISSSGLEYEHDLTYCLNIYCMNNRDL